MRSHESACKHLLVGQATSRRNIRSISWYIPRLLSSPTRPHCTSPPHTFFPAFSRDPRSFYLISRIVNLPEKSAWGRREPVAARGPRCSAIFLQQTSNTQPFIIIIPHERPSSWARSRALLRESGAPFCKGPHFQITVLKAAVMKRPRLPWPPPSRRFQATAHACTANLI